MKFERRSLDHNSEEEFPWKYIITKDFLSSKFQTTHFTTGSKRPGGPFSSEHFLLHFASESEYPFKIHAEDVAVSFNRRQRFSKLPPRLFEFAAQRTRASLKFEPKMCFQFGDEVI